MSRRLKQLVVVLVAVFAAAQLIRPGRANPPIDPARTIQAHSTTAGLAAIVDRSCGDCHSNATAWPWYTQIAPLSWVVARGVSEGRKAINFSEWGAYSPEQQRTLLAASCDDASAGRMPGAYALVRPDVKLSAEDVRTICAAAREADVSATSGRRER